MTMVLLIVEHPCSENLVVDRQLLVALQVTSERGLQHLQVHFKIYQTECKDAAGRRKATIFAIVTSFLSVFEG